MQPGARALTRLALQKIRLWARALVSGGFKLG
ncbi:hypothetical protein IWX87_002418 [Polaromonas sp. CG_9.7]|nr:hypothetical protein [Polaromonas sp. CG_9.7]MBG6114627.1 hypothetical protein [Polaromonas sp. CG_9.2]MDH6185210.1 hypothetical protein [Polaromonas sp. CG_23.6]